MIYLLRLLVNKITGENYMELWELYDDDKKNTGLVIQRGEPIPKGYHFLCVEVWIINVNQEALLTKRHPDKPVYPCCWEIPGGGVIKAESEKEAAVREVKEETGIKIPIEKLRFMGDYVGNSYIISTYFYYLEGNPYPKLTLQKEEVTDARWVALDQLNNEKQVIREKIERFFKYFPHG